MRKKNKRYLDLANFENVYQGEPVKINQKLFPQEQPLVLELACGRGEYTNGLAKVFPEKNFLGVDIKGERLWQGATESKKLGLTNTGFVRASIDQLEHYFDENSISELWIIHPDPQPKRERRRLTHPKYLQKYFNLLVPGGLLKIKTDDADLYKYSMETVPEFFNLVDRTNDLDNSLLLSDHFGISTNFERKAKLKGLTIHYGIFKKIK